MLIKGDKEKHSQVFKTQSHQLSESNSTSSGSLQAQQVKSKLAKLAPGSPGELNREILHGSNHETLVCVMS